MGVLDAPFRELASKLIGAFTDTKGELRRITTNYSPTAGPQAIAGSASSYTVSGAHSAGDTTVTVTGGTGAFAEGDQIVLGTEKMAHRVTAASADPATSLTIEPGLHFAQSGGEAIVVTGAETIADILFSPPSPYSSHEVDGETIQRDDLRTFVSASDLEAAWSLGAPLAGDHVILSGVRAMLVVRVKPVSSGDQNALYELQVRA